MALTIKSSQELYNQRYRREIGRGRNVREARAAARRFVKMKGARKRESRKESRQNTTQLTRVQIFKELRSNGVEARNARRVARRIANRDRDYQEQRINRTTLMFGHTISPTNYTKSSLVQQGLGEQDQLARLKAVMEGSDDGLKALSESNQKNNLYQQQNESKLVGTKTAPASDGDKAASGNTH